MPYQPKLNPEAVLQGYTQPDPRIVGAIQGFVGTTAEDIARAQQLLNNSSKTDNK